MVNRKLIVIASSRDDVVIVTPRSRHAARGQVADSVAVAMTMVDHPKVIELLDEVAPCTATDQEAALDLKMLRRLLAGRPKASA